MVVIGMLFVVVKLRTEHPLLDVRLFTKPAFATGAAGATLLYFAMYSYPFVAPHMQLVLGYAR